MGTIGDPVESMDVFSISIGTEDYSAWIGNCNNPGETFFDPEPDTTEIIWTVFKTANELVFECNGVFCLKYTYSDSTLGNAKCNNFKQPSMQLSFSDLNGQAAEHYRASGTAFLDY